MVTLDTTDVAARARALVGLPVTVYTRDQEWGTVVDHGLLGHVHQGVYLTMARPRPVRGLPPELVRVMLATVEDVHPEAEDAVPAHRLRPGHVLTAGPWAGARITTVQMPEQFGAGVVRLTIGGRVVWADASTPMT
jgi:hypothetical protein